MPSLCTLLASRSVRQAMSLYRCPVDPLLGLLAALDEPPDEWATLVLSDLQTIAAIVFGQEAKLEDPYHDWPEWVSDMILRPSAWEAMLSKACRENWWGDPTNTCDKDVVECGYIDRAKMLVAFALEQCTCAVCDQVFSRSRLLDHAQYCSKSCRDMIVVTASWGLMTPLLHCSLSFIR